MVEFSNNDWVFRCLGFKMQIGFSDDDWVLQMTEGQIEQWDEDPDKFVEDEDEDSFSYSVR